MPPTLIVQRHRTTILIYFQKLCGRSCTTTQPWHVAVLQLTRKLSPVYQTSLREEEIHGGLDVPFPLTCGVCECVKLSFRLITNLVQNSRKSRPWPERYADQYRQPTDHCYREIGFASRVVDPYTARVASAERIGEFQYRRFLLVHIRQGARDSKRETHDHPRSWRQRFPLSLCWCCRGLARLFHRLNEFQRVVGTPVFI